MPTVGQWAVSSLPSLYVHILGNAAMQKYCGSSDIFQGFIWKRYSMKFPHYPATEKGHSCMQAFWQEWFALGLDVIQSYSEYYTAAAWPSPVMLIIRAFLVFQMELVSFSSLVITNLSLLFIFESLFYLNLFRIVSNLLNPSLAFLVHVAELIQPYSLMTCSPNLCCTISHPLHIKLAFLSYIFYTL